MTKFKPNVTLENIVIGFDCAVEGAPSDIPYGVAILAQEYGLAAIIFVRKNEDGTNTGQIYRVDPNG